MSRSNRRPADGQSKLEFVREVLEAEGWEIDHEDERTLRAAFDGDYGRFWAYAGIPAEVDLLLCRSLFAFELPADLNLAAAELVAHLNFRLRLGTFDIDFDKGEIRFKSSLDLRGVDLNDHLVLNVFVPCVYVMDQCFPALHALLVERKSVDEARALAFPQQQ